MFTTKVRIIMPLKYSFYWVSQLQTISDLYNDIVYCSATMTVSNMSSEGIPSMKWIPQVAAYMPVGVVCKANASYQ